MVRLNYANEVWCGMLSWRVLTLIGYLLIECVWLWQDWRAFDMSLLFDAQAIGSSLAAGGQVNAHTYAIFLGDAASYWADIRFALLLGVECRKISANKLFSEILLAWCLQPHTLNAFIQSILWPEQPFPFTISQISSYNEPSEWDGAYSVLDRQHIILVFWLLDPCCNMACTNVSTLQGRLFWSWQHTNVI